MNNNKNIFKISHTGTALLKYLTEKFPKLTFALICKLCRKGAIKVNNKKTSHNRILNIGDAIQTPDLTEYIDSNAKLNVSASDKKEFEKYIIFEDENIIAINKPNNIATQGGYNIKKSIDKLALSYNPNLKLVHRLDKETSGVLVLAKTPLVASQLSKSFSNNDCRKTYYAITHGYFSKKKGIIDKPIKKITGSRFGTSVIDNKDGKKAITQYEVLQAKKNLSLVSFYPITGRTHQIRVHSANIGHSILGDVKYGGEPANRLFLHAVSISFSLGKKKYKVESPLDEKFLHHFPYR